MCPAHDHDHEGEEAPGTYTPHTYRPGPGPVVASTDGKSADGKAKKKYTLDDLDSLDKFP